MLVSSISWMIQQRRLRRSGGPLIMALALSAVITASSCSSSPRIESLVDVGGHRLFYQLHGSGTPTVIIDVGVGESFHSWIPVVSDLSKTVAVLVYDRAGYGRSEMGSLPRNAAAEAADLKALLQEANIPAPYLLVGHSLGGLNMQVLAHAHRADIAGLVLLDPPPRGWMAGNAFSALKQVFLRATEDMTKAAAEARRSAGGRGSIQAAFLTTIASEHEEMLGSTARQVLEISDFGDLRMIVIASERPNPAFGEDAEAYQKYWIEESLKLAGLSTSGEFILARRSGHQIHRDAPQLVVKAIRRLLAKSLAD